MTAPILVTGGTGTLGRLVIPRLRDAGRDVRVLSRHGHEDRHGIEHVTGDLTSSVVGADRIPVVSGVDRAMFGYFAAKLAAEQVIAGSGLPWTTLRATQFHDLTLLTVRQLARLPVVPVPAGWRVQPVDAGEVAAGLVELALGRPAGLVPDLGGPRVYELGDLVRGYLRATGRQRPILPVRLPGRAARAYRAGANLTPDRAVGRRTWEEFLSDRLGPALSPATATGSRGR
jgi:uncharacterized protein YbjT (DUF2867 family)